MPSSRRSCRVGLKGTMVSASMAATAFLAASATAAAVAPHHPAHRDPSGSIGRPEREIQSAAPHQDWTSWITQLAIPDYPFNPSSAPAAATATPSSPATAEDGTPMPPASRTPSWSPGAPNAQGVAWGDPANLATELASCAENEWAMTFEGIPATSQAAQETTELLASLNGPTTWFVAPSAVAQSGRLAVDTIKAAMEAGHQIGFTGWSGKPLSSMSFDHAFADIVYAAAATYQAIGKVPRYFRPSANDLDDRTRHLLLSLSLRPVQYNVDPHDLLLLANQQQPTDTAGAAPSSTASWTVQNATDLLDAVFVQGAQANLRWVPYAPSVHRSAPAGSDAAANATYPGFVSLHHLPVWGASGTGPGGAAGDVAWQLAMRLHRHTAATPTGEAAQPPPPPPATFHMATVAQCDAGFPFSAVAAEAGTGGAYLKDGEPFLEFVKSESAGTLRLLLSSGGSLQQAGSAAATSAGGAAATEAGASSPSSTPQLAGQNKGEDGAGAGGSKVNVTVVTLVGVAVSLAMMVTVVVAFVALRARRRAAAAGAAAGKGAKGGSGSIERRKVVVIEPRKARGGAGPKDDPEAGTTNPTEAAEGEWRWNPAARAWRWISHRQSTRMSRFSLPPWATAMGARRTASGTVLGTPAVSGVAVTGTGGGLLAAGAAAGGGAAAGAGKDVAAEPTSPSAAVAAEMAAVRGRRARFGERNTSIASSLSSMLFRLPASSGPAPAVSERPLMAPMAPTASTASEGFSTLSHGQTLKRGSLAQWRVARK
ncbi:chitin deacetylase [Phlyctochytrium bullatum]|nr:chitin deacetylase [Phlyctochytrium bullatum]